MTKIALALLDALLRVVFFLIVEDRYKKIAFAVLATGLTYVLYLMARGSLAWLMALESQARWLILAGAGTISAALWVRLFLLMIPRKEVWQPIEEKRRN